MPLFNLLNSPFDSDAELEIFWWSHVDHHRQIVQAVKTKKGVNLTPYPMYPFNKNDIETILLTHQQYHDDMNSALGLNGLDLQEIDIKSKEAQAAWVNQNYREHAAAAAALGI